MARRAFRPGSSPPAGWPSRWPASWAPEGIHVAHVVIDGQIHTPQVTDRDTEELLDPDAYWTLLTQDRSAWTLELDLRPHVESF